MCRYPARKGSHTQTFAREPSSYTHPDLSSPVVLLSFHFRMPPERRRAFADPGRKSPTCNDATVGRSAGSVERAGTPKAREHSKRLVCGPSRLQPTSAFERCSRAFSRYTPENAQFLQEVFAKRQICTSRITNAQTTRHESRLAHSVSSCARLRECRSDVVQREAKARSDNP